MIDTRGFGCPTPVLMVREALQKDAPASLEVLADARVAVEDRSGSRADADEKMTDRAPSGTGHTAGGGSSRYSQNSSSSVLPKMRQMAIQSRMVGL